MEPIAYHPFADLQLLCDLGSQMSLACQPDDLGAFHLPDRCTSGMHQALNCASFFLGQFSQSQHRLASLSAYLLVLLLPTMISYLPDAPLSCLIRKFSDIISAQTEIQRDMQTYNVVISTQSSIDLSAISSNSVDYIFTDPPYADKVQYGELNFVWEAWLGFDTNWHEDEII